jgi:hypothetical protein
MQSTDTYGRNTPFQDHIKDNARRARKRTLKQNNPHNAFQDLKSKTSTATTTPATVEAPPTTTAATAEATATTTPAKTTDISTSAQTANAATNQYQETTDTPKEHQAKERSLGTTLQYNTSNNQLGAQTNTLVLEQSQGATAPPCSHTLTQPPEDNTHQTIPTMHITDAVN